MQLLYQLYNELSGAGAYPSGGISTSASLVSTGTGGGVSGNVSHVFHTTLRPSEEVPPLATPSNGIGTGYFEMRNNGLYYNITVTNLTSPITAAHFHFAAKGVAGPVIRGITFTDNHTEGVWSDITNAQANDLRKGLIYVNVHTANHPAGEVRGQLMWVK